ncbi:MAG: EscV/YscV/HrcV family type III secretion system export apparatus protein [Planctomycetaceae bacterium]|nr:EscV/YscV/HrcV family type III secretion system export apparatus protein [Planctomycetaceae bacterium]
MSRFPRASELILPIGLIICLLVVLSPVPPELLDLLLIGNIAISVIILLTTVYVAAPLEFSVFPTVLLATTLGRLVLNVATTRIILTEGSQGITAAGGVIQSFGQFVAGDQVLVGLVIFSIIAVIQFVVITKGATRISEVTARFALDGMPGKQMAVDADLNAGVITNEEAVARRNEITRQADFYGAMDGASKFVRGDAIAAVFITLINILGGLAIGIFQYQMSPLDAADVFTKLTIGDGLVSQVPALFISLAAGLLVTRSTQRTNLPVDFLSQLLNRPQVMWAAAGVLGLLMLTSLPRLPLFVLAVGCCGAAVLLRGPTHTAPEKSQSKKTSVKGEPQKLEPRIEEYLAVDPVELELGLSLVRLADVKRGGSLLSRITELRQSIAVRLGLVLPKVRIRDNLRLDESQYRIKVNGNSVASAELPMDLVFMTGSRDQWPALEGKLIRHPAFSQPLLGVMPEQIQVAKQAGLEILDPLQVLLRHLRIVVNQHAPELLTRDATRHLVDETRKTSPAVVDELIPDIMKLSDVQRILQRLLSEGVSIRQLSIVLETLGDESDATKSDVELTESVRQRLARTICAQFRDERERLHVITLDPALEEQIQEAGQLRGRELMLDLPSQQVESICRSIDRELEQLRGQGRPEIVLVTPEIRPMVKRLTRHLLPQIIVLSYAEITAETKVVSLGIVSEADE